MSHGGVEQLLYERKRAREDAVHHYANGGGVHATAQKLQGMGRNGDTILAHINPEEAALLKRMGGSGKINPNTGLMSFDNPSMGAYDGPKTDTSGGPGSAPGGDGSSSGSQGMGAGTGSVGSSGGDYRDQGRGSGVTSNRPDLGGGNTGRGIADLPAPTAVESARKTYVSPLTKKYFDAGIIPNEGGIDPKTGEPLTSPKGAHGIAQVTEDTGPEAAADAGLEWDRNKWLTDTQYNYDIGLAYYGKLVDKYKGNYVDAAAAYNTGMGNYNNFLSGKQGLAAETQKYIKDFTAKTAGISTDPSFDVPDHKPYVIASTDPLKALSATPTSPTPAAEPQSWWDQTVHNAPGTIGSTVLSAVVPGVGLYNMVSGVTNYLTGEKTLPSLSDKINDAYYGTGTTAPTDSNIIGGYGPSGGKITNTDPMQMYKELYGGGSDKKLLGIESLDRSPLVPEIDPSVPLFEFDYSKFGIKGE